MIYEIGIDIETYSDVNIMDSGVYKYVESPAFEILIICYCFDGDIKNVYTYGEDEKTDQLFLDALTDPAVLKTAHNAPFEMTCLAKFFNINLPVIQWHCTMALASMCGYPMGLDTLGKALNLDTQKDSKGKALIRYFTMPCKPTEKNGFNTRNLPINDALVFLADSVKRFLAEGKNVSIAIAKKLEKYILEVNDKWADFVAYCVQDVIQEQKAKKLMQFYLPLTFERKLYVLDQKINKRGIRLDTQFARKAVEMDTVNRELLIEEMKEITGLQNPNSGAQLKKWIQDITGDQITSLTKASRVELLKEDYPDYVLRALEISSEVSKTSVTKYLKALAAVCSDGYIKGMLQYYGAGTGRWAGRIVQPHNLPRISFEKENNNLDIARKIVKEGDLKYLQFLFGNVPGTLSQLLRTMLIPSKGCRLLIADFKAIEACVIAWVANEKWRLDVFSKGGDIYLASAEMMFNLPTGSLTKKSPLRQQGKVAELALGFQGGAGALQIMDVANAIPAEDYEKIKNAWRKASPKIVQLWYGTQNAAIEAITQRRTTQYRMILFSVIGKILLIELPSGRKLSYPDVILKPNQWGRDSIWFKGVDPLTKQVKMISLYGGLIVENIVQGIARDVMAYGMMRLDKKGYSICLHVHDEIVCDEPIGDGNLAEMTKCMTDEIPWAIGLPLGVDAYEANYYKKD